MISEEIKKQIISIWDKYIVANKKVLDTKGNDLDNIDEKRIEAIVTLKIIIFLSYMKTVLGADIETDFWFSTKVK